MRFLGRKWQKKNNNASKGNITSRLALQATLRRYPNEQKRLPGLRLRQSYWDFGRRLSCGI